MPLPRFERLIDAGPLPRDHRDQDEQTGQRDAFCPGCPGRGRHSKDESSLCCSVADGEVLGRSSTTPSSGVEVDDNASSLDSVTSE